MEARGSCTSKLKHSALEGGEGGLDADHACEALDAAAAGGRRALLHDVAHDHTHESRFRAALCEASAGANSEPFRGLVSEGQGF